MWDYAGLCAQIYITTDIFHTCTLFCFGFIMRQALSRQHRRPGRIISNPEKHFTTQYLPRYCSTWFFCMVLSELGVFLAFFFLIHILGVKNKEGCFLRSKFIPSVDEVVCGCLFKEPRWCAKGLQSFWQKQSVTDQEGKIKSTKNSRDT